MSKSGGWANYGIAGNVNATAVAVGPHASAVVNQAQPASRPELDTILADLRNRIGALDLAGEHRDAAQRELSQLEAMAGPRAEPKPGAADAIGRLVKAIQSGGALLNTIAALHGPLAQVASWFHVALPF
jgi:hypothetical protein